MKGFWILFILALIQSQIASAQFQKPIKYQVRFSPPALLDPLTPCVQIGGQATYKKVAGSLEVGLPFKGLAYVLLNKPASLEKGNKYIRIRNEFKYLFYKQSDFYPNPKKSYLSIESFFVPQKYHETNYYRKREGKSYHYDYSRVKKEVWGMCFKFGRELPLGRILLVDYSVGLGFRKVKISHNAVGLREEEEEYQEAESFDFDLSHEKEEGLLERPHLAAGLKLGFKLN